MIVGGQIVHTFKCDEPFGNVNVSDFNSFIEATGMLLTDNAIITVSDKGISCVCDSNKPHLRASVRMEFERSQAVKALEDWETTPKSIGVINKLLRTKLAGTFDEKFLSIFRQIEFSRGSATRIEKSNVRDTMGKTVDNAVKSLAGEIPEYIAFDVLLFVNAPCVIGRYLYYIDVDHDNERIGISAVGDAANVTRATLSDIVLKLQQNFTQLVLFLVLGSETASQKVQLRDRKKTVSQQVRSDQVCALSKPARSRKSSLSSIPVPDMQRLAPHFNPEHRR